MADITISRQLGSLGWETARLLQAHLGYRLVGRDLINAAAQRASAPEVALAMIDEFKLLGVKPKETDIQAYLAGVQAVMHELAEQGKTIIVGRAGQIILAGRSDILHVRMIAPVTLRASRLAQRLGIPLAAARAQIDASDRFHQQYFKHYYRIPWDGPGLYDLVINTEKLAPDDAAEIICAALGRCACPCSSPQSPSGDAA
jgi:cytidylate kinase